MTEPLMARLCWDLAGQAWTDDGLTYVVDKEPGYWRLTIRNADNYVTSAHLSEEDAKTAANIDFARRYPARKEAPELATELARLQAENEALRRERDEARANSVSRGKKLLRLRAKIVEISDNIEHEGDRAYFGSTNDADELRAAFLWLDSFKWDRVMSESDDDDLLSGIENAVARANASEAAREAAEAKAARLEEALAVR